MNRYNHPSHSIAAEDLPSTANDVYILEKKLKQLDFETTSFLDCSLENMTRTVDSFAIDAPCDSLNIIYFSGHGGQSQGQNYVYPVDFGTNIDNKLMVEESAFNIQQFTKAFNREIKLVIIIDACRDNLTLKYNHNYSEMVAPKNTYIAYATQFNEQSVCTAQISYFTETLGENI
ncbi:MAG: caspase family protein [Thermincola sp.]|nr:caspase family protein [Thermincola sp.]MDT3703308.1 caspase family protein [Thermincola sp.]